MQRALRLALALTSLLAAARARARAEVVSPAAADESAVLLGVIKKSLRRNNDDYEDVPSAVDGPAVGSAATATGPQPPHTGPSADTTGTVLKSDTREQSSWRVATPSSRRRPSATGDGAPAVTDEKRLLHKNWWKRLFEKSKMLGMYRSGSNFTPSSAVARAEAAATRASPLAGGEGAAHRPRPPGPVRAAERAAPDADQLDMAPARGAYVHSLRAKNRFCQRHVLWPEGPKYDGDGNTIMPMFHSKWYDGKDFFQTAKPRVVLPRCCNCCKKSVLGCQ